MAGIDNILALDVGEKRIGVAIASTISRLPRPYTTLTNGPDITGELKRLIKTESIGLLVVGVPRNLSGQDTRQTSVSLSFIKKLKDELEIPIIEQDEALTSVKAEAELKSHGRPYDKAEVDSLAATYILEDYLQEAEA